MNFLSPEGTKLEVHSPRTAELGTLRVEKASRLYGCWRGRRKDSIPCLGSGL